MKTLAVHALQQMDRVDRPLKWHRLILNSRLQLLFFITYYSVPAFKNLHEEVIDTMADVIEEVDITEILSLLLSCSVSLTSCMCWLDLFLAVQNCGYVVFRLHAFCQ